MSRLVISLLLVLAGSAACAAAAATNQVAESTAEQQFQAALVHQAEAGLALTRKQALRAYRQALAAYAAAAARRSDHYPTHILWATCLTQLGSIATNDTERLRLLQEADQRFAVAADCAGIDQPGLEAWASLLMGPLLKLAPDADRRRELMERTAAICERGLQLPAVPTPEGQFHRYLGMVRSAQARASTDPARQRALFETAVAHFRQARESVTVRALVDRDNQLGVALLRLGNLLDDGAYLREAAAELEAALALQPGNQMTRYNLAVARSLLGEPDAAAVLLAVVFDNDPQGNFLRYAEQDADLAAVRGSEVFILAVDRRRRRLAEREARTLFRQGLRAQQTAERTNDVEVATALLEQATNFYQQAVAVTPEHYPAQALYATALAQLASLSPARSDQQRQYLNAGRSRFAIAAQCPACNPQLHDQWSTFLLAACYPLETAPADQRRVLEETRRVLEDGIQRVRFTGLRGRLEAQLGTCLVLLAQLDGPGPAAGLYAAALPHFQTAAIAEAVTRSANYYELWGIALLRVGRATKDTMLLRRAAERLAKAIKLAPDNPSAHYNLACVYAQLLQPDRALRHLERSLALETQGLFYYNTQRDPDLEPLRRTDAYQRLFPPPQLRAPDRDAGVSGK